MPMASKIKIDDVKRDIEEKGWKLISSSYSNLKTDLQLICPENHECFCSYEKWRRGNFECPICKQNKYYHVDNIAVKKKGFRILAFDQASITSGWSVFDDGTLVKYGAWTSDGSKSTQRIAKTKYWVAAMIDKWNPDQVILEDIQLQRFDSGQEGVITFKKLAHLQGVLKNYLYESGIQYKVVSPSTWRSHSEIKGKTRVEKKKNAQIKVKRFYDVSVSQDEADAILIGRWAVNDNKKNQVIDF